MRIHTIGNVRIVARFLNNGHYGNTTMRFLIIVVDLIVIGNKYKPVEVCHGNAIMGSLCTVVEL